MYFDKLCAYVKVKLQVSRTENLRDSTPPFTHHTFFSYLLSLEIIYTHIFYPNWDKGNSDYKTLSADHYVLLSHFWEMQQ